MIEMESEEKRVHQEKMKKWGCRLVIFFVFMWICTIVSKSIYISRLPQVKAQTMEKKYVEHVVKVEGITVIVDGIFKEFLDVIKMKQPNYKNNVSVLQDALMKGLEEIRKSL